MLKPLIWATGLMVALPHVASAENTPTLSAKGLIQADFASYDNDSGLEDGSRLRRARLGVGGKLSGDVDYQVSLDFGGGSSDDKGRIFEVWTQYKPSDELTFKVGLFTPNVGLSDAGSSSATPLIERPAVVDMARNIAGGDTRMAAVLSGRSQRVFYLAGLTGATVGKPDSKGQSALIARAAYLPLKTDDTLIHIGLNGQFLLSVPDQDLRLRERTELRVDETRLIDAGAFSAQGLSVYGLEFGVQHKNVFVQAETFRFDLSRQSPATGVSDPRFGGWYIEGGWVLTGEKRKYNAANAAFDGVKPARAFNLQSGDWGAWEVTARYSHLGLDWHADAALPSDRVRGGRQTVASLGVGWTLDSHLRVVAQAQQVEVERRNAAGADIGRSYSAFGLRTQLSF